MSILFVMIPLALLLLAASIYAFFWAVRTGQFDDLETQGTLVLFDDEKPGTGTGFRRDAAPQEKGTGAFFPPAAPEVPTTPRSKETGAYFSLAKQDAGPATREKSGTGTGFQFAEPDALTGRNAASPCFYPAGKR